MNQKAFVLQNRGMNRDLSVSKVGQSSAFENHNIRIVARDHDTLLSVTNERGTKEINLGENVSIDGTLIGWNVIDNHIILFTHDENFVDEDYPDYKPKEEGEATITYRYKVVTTLSSYEIQKTNTSTAKATLYRKTFVDGVPSTGWQAMEQGSDVTSSGFTATSSTSSVTISGSTITGNNIGEATIRSNYVADEYTDAKIVVHENGTVITVEYKVTVTSDATDNKVAVGESVHLSAKRLERTVVSGTAGAWGHEADVTSYGFYLYVGDDENATIHDTSILTCVAAGTNIEVRSNYTPTANVTFVDLELSLVASGGGSGSGSGGGGGDIPVMGGLTFNASASWLSETSLQYFLQIENSNPTPATINGIAVRLVQTETQQDLPSGGELVRMVDCGEGQITIPALDSSEPIIKTIENISYTEGYTLWIQGVATNYYNGEYSPIDEYQEGPSDTMSLLALSGSVETPDRIYRIDYIPGREDGEFVMVRGKYDPEDFETGSGSGSGSGHTVPDNKYNVPLFEGNLHLSANYPIESIVSSESDDIQKIYWVDGRNVLRFMNVVEEGTVDALTGDLVMPWDGDNTYFDSNRGAGCGVSVSVEKDNSGNTRANGVVQYMMTYFNKHGQETGTVWASDLIYLSPVGSGGAADETNNNKVTLTISEMSTAFDHFRIYSVFRSSLNGEAVTYLVSEQNTTTGDVIVIDDGAHLISQDTTKIFYLGSQAVIAGTLTHKDQTLFLGDLRSIGKRSISTLESLINTYMFCDASGDPAEFEEGVTWRSRRVSFEYSNDVSAGTDRPEVDDFAYVKNVGNYPYENQLIYSSSEILTFKGGEKYRFALKFKYKDGTETDAFWIGDAENELYPVIDNTNSKVKRVVARCIIPSAIVNFLKTSPDNFDAVQLLVAEANDADRSVKAQGIVNPTMFNVWERYSKRLYAMPSWISRPRGSQFAFRHFEPVGDCTTSVGEIQCNFWNSKTAPVPFYQYKDKNTSPSYVENYDGTFDFTHIFMVYKLRYSENFGFGRYDVTVRIVKATLKNGDYDDAMSSYEFIQSSFYDMPYYSYNTTDNSKNGWHYYNRLDNSDNIVYTIEAKVTDEIRGQAVIGDGDAKIACYNNMRQHLHDVYNIPFSFIVSNTVFYNWCDNLSWNSASYFHSKQGSDATAFTNAVDALNYLKLNGSTVTDATLRWKPVSDYSMSDMTGDRAPAYAKKHLMFVDENVVTLDSPELTYGTVSLDKAGYKFRIVGVAKMSSVVSDYIVDATHSSTPGAPMDEETFSGNIENRVKNIHGILSWPLWKEYGLDLSGDTEEDRHENTYTPSEYSVGDTVVRYWLYMWQHSGIISGYTPAANKDEEEENVIQATLKHKIFANLRFSYNTIYLSSPHSMASVTESIRMVNDLNDYYNNLKIGGRDTYYTNKVQLSLTVPGTLRYPIVYSPTRPDETSKDISSDDAFLHTDSPCLIQYRTGAHAVISFSNTDNGSTYTQKILPYFFSSDIGDNVSPSSTVTGALLPWVDGSSEYYFDSTGLSFAKNHSAADTLTSDDQYLFIGEIYREFPSNADTRYGGITLSAVFNNRFIPAGPLYLVNDMTAENNYTIFGNQGDTYFQRWDCLRTKPYSDDAENKVIDITSVMLETHINLDGRTDLQRGLAEVASIDTANYGVLNRVYSQKNNLSVRRDLDEEYNTDSYRSSITWSLPKADAALTDEWTHVTLASSLKLDADRGICRALRRYNNSIVAFQDKAISEVMFNSRTQLTTSDGVPVEIANSGKVDGNRYISDKYGCINKWSITEGKAGLYFVDNINKAFCALGAGNGVVSVDNLSTKLGFGVWFRNGNSMNPWMPSVFNNIVSYYDKVHSDVYLVRKETGTIDGAALVYNELLGAFTSFFDYGSVPMMTNVNDRFISFYNGSLWKQNEGYYCDFFGTLKPFWIQYRVTPEPYSDKIWTNVEYRADFYRLIDGGIDNYIVEKEFTDDVGVYQPNETFDYMRFWNEYQTTEDDESKYNLTPEKRFRIWRLAIPRAMKNINNPYGLDRIRNPWLNLIFKKNAPDADSKKDLMQLHDIIVTYYE